jgi:hypothetical protein
MTFLVPPETKASSSSSSSSSSLSSSSSASSLPPLAPHTPSRSRAKALQRIVDQCGLEVDGNEAAYYMNGKRHGGLESSSVLQSLRSWSTRPDMVAILQLLTTDFFDLADVSRLKLQHKIKAKSPGEQSLSGFIGVQVFWGLSNVVFALLFLYCLAVSCHHQSNPT